MSKAELKTKPTAVSVDDFVDSIQNEGQREDSKTILKLMRKISGEKGKMWGSAIVGFVDIQLKYASGRDLEWFRFGFSPRKQALTIYGILSMNKEIPVLVKKLGKYKTGKGCLYIKKLTDIDMSVLEELIRNASKTQYLTGKPA